MGGGVTAEEPQAPGALAQQRGRRRATRSHGDGARLDGVPGDRQARDQVGEPAGAHALGTADRRQHVRAHDQPRRVGEAVARRDVGGHRAAARRLDPVIAEASPGRAAQPPATAGRIVTSSPSATGVASPSRKRMSSPLR